MSGERPTLAMLETLGPARAAALWLERLQRDEEGEDDALFRQWLEANEANRLAWDKAQDLWDVFEEEDEDDVFAALRTEALTLPSRRAQPAAFRPTWPWYAGGAVAASVAAVLVAGPLLSRLARDGDRASPVQVAGAPSAPLSHAGPPDYETGVGQRTTVALSDGSKVELDTNSAINVAYTAGRRQVRLLRGQAFFDVAHDASRPFRVAVAGRVVSDLGTRFDIRLQAGETRIVLEQGSVAVSRGDDPGQPPGADAQTLTPGQQLLARPDRADQVGPADVEHASDWRRGLIQFDGVPLSQAVAEVNRYTARQLVIRDPSVAALRVSGAFRTGDIDRFAETLTALYPVRLAQTSDGRTEIAPR